MAWGDGLTGARRWSALVRWLGPWADAQAVPRAGRGDGGAVLLVPGMHFLGVDDPRFMRFGAILRAAGARVTTADVGGLRALRLAPTMFEDAERALLAASADGPVGVMSVSFGSIAALHLAAKYPNRVRRLVLFGGYRDLESTLRFTLGEALGAEAPARACDPLNAPAVFIQLVDALLPEAAREAFIEAARAFCVATWSTGAGGAADAKHDGRHLRVGAQLAATLDEPARSLMRVACRLEGDLFALALDALARSTERFGFLDPGPLLGQIQCEVDCIHGRDDDVIPYAQSEALAADLRGHGVRARAHITGLYGHTGAGSTGGRPGLSALAREATTTLAVLQAVARLVSKG